jgi:hypothetical protein
MIPLPTPARVSERVYQDRRGWYIYFWDSAVLPRDLWDDLGEERQDLRCVWVKA